MPFPVLKTLHALTVGLVVATVAHPRAAISEEPDAGAVFAEAREICERDNGALWGVSLCGPILLIDPTDRTVVTNTADPLGVLRPTQNEFRGVLPPDVIVANTSVEWSGLRWTMMLQPLPEDEVQRHVFIAHELFHRIQPQVGLGQQDGNNAHLDEMWGRYLLQLEWRALARALSASTPETRLESQADALAFRWERYRLFPAAASAEAALEANEGVAEYTGVRLGLEDPQVRVDYARRALGAFVDAPSFVRSFAYATGPAYGLMLDEATPDWRDRLLEGRRFDELLAEGLDLTPSETSSVADRTRIYDDGSLWDREQVRDQNRQARLATLKAALVDGPILTLPLRGASFQFNPQTLQPLGDHGTVYPGLRLSGPWGVLVVEGVALLNRSTGSAAVSAVGMAASGLSGEGWSLTLSPGWELTEGARPGDFRIVEVEPVGDRTSARQDGS